MTSTNRFATWACANGPPSGRSWRRAFFWGFIRSRFWTPCRGISRWWRRSCKPVATSRAVTWGPIPQARPLGMRRNSSRSQGSVVGLAPVDTEIPKVGLDSSGTERPTLAWAPRVPRDPRLAWAPRVPRDPRLAWVPRVDTGSVHPVWILTMDNAVQLSLLNIFSYLLPEMVLVGAACVLFLGSTFRATRQLWGTVTLIALGFAGGLVFITADFPRATGGTAYYASPLLFDSFAYLIKYLAVGTGVIFVLFSWNEVGDRQAPGFHGCPLVL